MRPSAWFKQLPAAEAFLKAKLRARWLPRASDPSRLGLSAGILCGLVFGAFAAWALDPSTPDLKVAAVSCDVTPPTIHRDDHPLVRLHHYATHLMSYYGDGRATSDAVGLARARIEREEGERLAKNPEVEISSLKIGPATCLYLPGEA